MTTPTFDQVLMSARQLAPRERARLVAVIVEELAEPTAAAPAAPAGGFARLRAVAADIHAHYPDADVGARLDADRRDRERAMLGEAHDVHP